MLHGSTNRHVRFGAFEADLSAGEVFREGKRLPIQNKPFRILEVLLRSGGEMVDREQLLRDVWPDTHVGAQSLNTAVRKLRQALDDDGAEPRIIETVGSLGHRLLVPVEFPSSAEAGPKIYAPVTLAVMPFQNLDSPDDDPFSAGLTEHMIAQLWRMRRNLSVVVPVSATYFKGTQRDALNLGQDPDFDYVLNGSVLCGESNLRITARLVGTRDRVCLWSESYLYRKNRVLESQEQITRQIARAILQVLPVPQLAQARTAALNRF